MKTKLLMVGVAVALGIGLVQASENDRDGYGERGEYGERSRYGEREEWRGRRGMDPVYAKECSACHIAYPADMLPQRSWDRIMGSLDDHFGENAELSSELHQQISHYLQRHAGDSGGYGSEMLRGLGRNDAPLRISELPRFKRKHREIPRHILADKQIGSLSNCHTCHRRAEQGSYSEREIDIPGYGRWED